MPSSHALLGGFAIGAQVALIWQRSTNAKCQRVLVLTLCLVLDCYGFAYQYTGAVVCLVRLQTHQQNLNWSLSSYFTHTCCLLMIREPENLAEFH